VSQSKTLSEILRVPEAERLQQAIVAKGASATLEGLRDPDKALRFIRSNLRGSYLFARFAVPAYAEAMFAVLPDFPPVDDAMGAMLTRILDAVKGELLNNNIFGRTGECHSHYHDAREAYEAAGGDMAEVQAFERDAARIGFAAAMATSSFWSPAARRYADALLQVAGDPLACFILMPANEQLAPRVYKAALANLPDEGRFAKFRTFFSRHVELDEGDHGPAALEWLDLYLKEAAPGRDQIAASTRRVLRYVTGATSP
jgi:hypothetical protein